MSKYTLKFYKGRKLVAEQTWNLNESFLDEITDEAESLIEEAIETNEGAEEIAGADITESANVETE